MFELMGDGIREEILNRRLGLPSSRPESFDKLDLIPLDSSHEEFASGDIHNL